MTAKAAVPTSDQLDQQLAAKRTELADAERKLGDIALSQAGRDDLDDLQYAHEEREKAEAAVASIRSEIKRLELAVEAAERKAAAASVKRDGKAETKKRQKLYEACAAYLDLVADLLRKRDALIDSHKALADFDLPKPIRVATLNGENAAASALDTELIEGLPRRFKRLARIDLHIATARKGRITAEDAAELATRARELAKLEAEGKGEDHSVDAEQFKADRADQRRRRQAERLAREAKEREAWAGFDAVAVHAAEKDGRVGTRTAERIKEGMA